MSEIIYKVLFKGYEESNDARFNLIFRGINSTTNIKISSDLILELKKISKLNQNYIYIQNISEVIKIEKTPSSLSYTNYFIILYKLKNGTREGFLIGNEKTLGDLLIGIWPFNKQSFPRDPDNIINKLINILEDPQEYDEILLIN
jgi:hypothetical protein